MINDFYGNGKKFCQNVFNYVLKLNLNGTLCIKDSVIGKLTCNTVIQLFGCNDQLI